MCLIHKQEVSCKPNKGGSPCCLRVVGHLNELIHVLDADNTQGGSTVDGLENCREANMISRLLNLGRFFNQEVLGCWQAMLCHDGTCGVLRGQYGPCQVQRESHIVSNLNLSCLDRSHQPTSPLQQMNPEHDPIT